MGAFDGQMTIAAAALFGLTSSVHCIGMCGGIALSVCAGKDNKFKPVALYTVSRLFSCTLVGLIVGLIGSALSLNQYLKALIPLLCGAITVLIGLRLMGLFRWLKFGFAEAEGCLAGKFGKAQPLVVGLLTGIMPCGTLQSVQFAALSSGSALYGAGIMFAFALASTPALAAVGVLSGFITAKNRKVLNIIAALLVLYMGVKMVLKGLTLLGVM